LVADVERLRQEDELPRMDRPQPPGGQSQSWRRPDLPSPERSQSPAVPSGGGLNFPL